MLLVLSRCCCCRQHHHLHPPGGRRRLLLLLLLLPLRRRRHQPLPPRRRPPPPHRHKEAGEGGEEEKKNCFPLLPVPFPSFQNQPARGGMPTANKKGGWGMGVSRYGGPPTTPPAPFSPVTNGCRMGRRKDEEDEAKSQESPLHILLCRNEEGLLSRWRQHRSRDGGWRGWASGLAPPTPPHLTSPPPFLPSFLSL